MRITKDPTSRREGILNAALELFKAEGFDNVSVESITQKAEISKGNFYNYFKSKEDAYEAVISSIASQTLASKRGMLEDKSLTPKERLKKYIDWTFCLSEQQERSLSRVLDQKANTNQQKMYLQTFDEGINQMLPIFEGLLTEGMETGEFKIPDARFTAVVMLGGFRSIHLSFYNTLGVDMETVKVYLYDFLSRLLGTSF